MQIWGNEGFAVTDAAGKVAAINKQNSLSVLIWEDSESSWIADGVSALPAGVETFVIHSQNEGDTFESFEWGQYEFVANDYLFTITPEPTSL